MNAKSYRRAPGQTKISVSIPIETVKRLDQRAEQEHRSRSNLITVLLDNKLGPPGAHAGRCAP